MGEEMREVLAGKMKPLFVCCSCAVCVLFVCYLLCHWFY